jgi:hypothetical protein
VIPFFASPNVPAGSAFLTPPLRAEVVGIRCEEYDADTVKVVVSYEVNLPPSRFAIIKFNDPLFCPEVAR